MLHSKSCEADVPISGAQTLAGPFQSNPGLHWGIYEILIILLEYNHGIILLEYSMAKFHAFFATAPFWATPAASPVSYGMSKEAPASQW